MIIKTQFQMPREVEGTLSKITDRQVIREGMKFQQVIFNSNHINYQYCINLATFLVKG